MSFTPPRIPGAPSPGDLTLRDKITVVLVLIVIISSPGLILALAFCVVGLFR